MLEMCFAEQLKSIRWLLSQGPTLSAATRSTSKDDAGGIQRTIFCNTESPKLKEVPIKSVIELKERRKLHETHVREKYKDPNTNIFPVSLKASIDDKFLRIVLAAE